jgi:hypothetical protein
LRGVSFLHNQQLAISWSFECAGLEMARSANGRVQIEQLLSPAKFSTPSQVCVTIFSTLATRRCEEHESQSEDREEQGG